MSSPASSPLPTRAATSLSRGARIALRSERGLFTVATSVLGLHLIDDNYLHPKPGTAAGDHLASGLVPLGVLALAAAAYPRLRAGARATTALLLGMFALIVGATSGAYEAATVGASGDDYTGLLAIPAALTLLALGIVTLWRSRRLDDRKWRRYVRRTLLVGATLLVANFVILPLGIGYGTTHVMRQSVPQAKLGAAYEDVSFTTSDGLRLQGWYVPSKNGAAVIAFPGRSGPQAHARMLARHGYGVLLFDRRGEGASDGDSNLFGWGGDRDILAAIEYLKTRPDVEPGRIGGMGFSVGGELMLQTAAETDDLAAVVSEGAGTRTFWEVMEEVHGAEKWLNLPLYAVQDAAVAVFSNSHPPQKLTDLAPKIDQPLFVIWAPNGGNVEHMSKRYYELARGPKQIWTMPTAKHVRGIYDQPKEYERRVVGFFDRALLDSPS